VPPVCASQAPGQQATADSTSTRELTLPLPEALTTKTEIQIDVTDTGRAPLRFGFAQLIPD